jgi:hypothetical protein
MTIQSGVALFKGYTDVDGPPVFYVPIVEFNHGATVSGKVVLKWYGADMDRCQPGRAYVVEYAKESREILRVLGPADNDGRLVH